MNEYIIKTGESKNLFANVGKVKNNVGSPAQQTVPTQRGKSSSPNALDNVLKVSGGNVGILKRVLREVGDVTIYLVLYNGVEIEAALAGNQYIFFDVAITLAKSDLGYSITSTPMQVVGQITSYDTATEKAIVDLFSKGSKIFSGTENTTPSSKAATPEKTVTAYCNLDGAGEAVLKTGAWCVVEKRHGVHFIANFINIPQSALKHSFFCDLFDRADAGTLNGYWDGGTGAWIIQNSSTIAVLASTYITPPKDTILNLIESSVSIDSYHYTILISLSFDQLTMQNGSGRVGTLLIEFGENFYFSVVFGALYFEDESTSPPRPTENFCSTNISVGSNLFPYESLGSKYDFADIASLHQTATIKIVASSEGISVFVNDVLNSSFASISANRKCGSIKFGQSVVNSYPQIYNILFVKVWEGTQNEPTQTGYGTYRADGFLLYKDKYHEAQYTDGEISGYTYNPAA